MICTWGYGYRMSGIGFHSFISMRAEIGAGSYLDLVGLDADTMESLRYQVADGGSEQAVRQVERIVVKGAPTVDLPIIETRWGPAIQVAKKTYAVHWAAYEPNAVNLH